VLLFLEPGQALEDPTHGTVLEHSLLFIHVLTPPLARYLQITQSAAVVGITSFASWLILCNVIIPISLYVYMEMVKVVMVPFSFSSARSTLP